MHFHIWSRIFNFAVMASMYLSFTAIFFSILSTCPALISISSLSAYFSISSALFFTYSIFSLSLIFGFDRIFSIFYKSFTLLGAIPSFSSYSLFALKSLKKSIDLFTASSSLGWFYFGASGFIIFFQSITFFSATWEAVSSSPSIPPAVPLLILCDILAPSGPARSLTLLRMFWLLSYSILFSISCCLVSLTLGQYISLTYLA